MKNDFEFFLTKNLFTIIFLFSYSGFIFDEECKRCTKYKGTKKLNQCLIYVMALFKGLTIFFVNFFRMLYGLIHRYRPSKSFLHFLKVFASRPHFLFMSSFPPFLEHAGVSLYKTFFSSKLTIFLTNAV